MKIKINKTQQKEIKKIRKIIKEHHVEEEKLVGKLTASMELTGEDAVILWDHVYNGSTWMVDLK
jgi:hypothetical protein